MKFDPQIHHRHSIRLKGYDYSQVGAYFVTIVAWQRQCLFGGVVDWVMRPNAAGKIVQWEWENLALSFKFIELGAFCVMPNHFHGILLFNDVGATRQGLIDASSGDVSLHKPALDGHDVGATRQGFINPSSGDVSLHKPALDGLNGSPLPPRGPKPATLGAIIGQFKSRVTKRLWKIPELSGTPIWQRNYYEHIIRNEREMERIWHYIESNPAMWEKDDENPNA
jgi:putative transposase